MATKKEENKEVPEVKKDTVNKKITTGNTKKVVEKRSSSTTNKTKTAKKTTSSNKTKQTTSKTTANKKTNNNKTTNSKNKTTNSTKKNVTKKDEKIATEKNKKQENKTEHSKEKKSNTKELSKIELEKIKDVLKDESKNNKKIPKEELNSIYKTVFKNIFLAIIIMFYFNFIVLGFINIENSIFLTDIKVFSLLILAIAIGILENAYKKDSGTHAIYGIETLILSIVTIGFIYLNIMYTDKFIPITVFIAYIFAIYYIAKSIIIYKKLKKQYYINNLKENIKKKED